MDVRLVLLISCLIVANCKSTISNRNVTTVEYELCEDMKSEMGSIRQLLMNLKHAAVRIEKHALRVMKSEIEDIRKSVIQLEDRNETQAIQKMKEEIEEIRQIKLKQQSCNENQAAQEIKSKIEVIYEIIRKQQNGNETQTIQEMNLKMEEIRQAVIRPKNRPKKECPLGFDYLPEAGSCYTLIFEEMTWDNATARCKEILSGVHLAEITSQAESNAVARYLQTQFNRTSIRSSGTAGWCDGGYLLWISGQRKNARCYNPFVWKTLNGIDVPFSYTNWGRGEPNCAGHEACVHMASCKAHAWNDFNCDLLSFPLCEV